MCYYLIVFTPSTPSNALNHAFGGLNHDDSVHAGVPTAPPAHRTLPQHVGDLQLCSGRDASHLFVRYSASNATRGPTILVIMCHLLYRGKYGACYQMPLFPTRGVINQLTGRSALNNEALL